MDNDAWKKLREEANQKADAQFASEVSDLMRLTKKQVEDIISAADIDKKALAELMAIVTDATTSNQAKATAIKNGVGLAEVAASLLASLK